MRSSMQHRSSALTAACRAALAALVLVPILLGSSPAKAVKVEVDKDTFLDFHLLVQPWGQFRYEDLKDDPNVQHGFGDFYLRRARIMVGGQITKWVSFFAETDQPNWGKGGDWSTTNPFFVQDAYVSFDIHEGFRIVAGMLLIPFIHNAGQGAGTLHNLDYHSDLMKYPLNSNKVWRDSGVMFRGLLLNKKIDYRIAITNGVQDYAEMIKGSATAPTVFAATGECPRFSGRLAYNFFDAEEGFFLGGTYLGQKKVLSLGFAYDTQPGVYGPKHNYWATGGDIFVDMPMGKGNRLTGQLDFVGYGGDHNPNRGKGFLFDLGYAMGKIEPLVAVDWYRPEVKVDATFSDFKNDFMGLHVGVNWWYMGHKANVKLDYGQIKSPGYNMGHSASVLTLQTQLFL
jgi:hypothetical protein